MNSLKNDKGQWVAQEGAENSPARVKCQYPALFERLDSLFCQEARIDKALEAIREWGIKEEWKTLLILEQTMYAYGKDINIIKAVTRGDNMGDKHKEHTDTDNIVCPFCGYEYQPEIREIKRELWEETCFKCDKKYTATIDYTVSFSTWGKK